MTANFDDGKEDGALRTIGELGKALGLKPHVLRYWEEQFPMLQPLKRSGNRRYYRPEDVALVELIDRLVNHEGYTLKGARQAVESGREAMGEPHSASPDSITAAPMSAEPSPELDMDSSKVAKGAQTPPEVLAQLKDIRANLAAAIGA